MKKEEICCIINPKNYGKKTFWLLPKKSATLR